MTTKYFIGACILTVGLLIKAGAPLFAIAMGIALAGVFHWMRARGAVSK